MVNIQPVVFPIIGTATKLGVSISAFATDAKTCTVYYALMTTETKRIVEDDFQLTDQQFADWGVDNSYIDQLVATKLGVVIVPESMDDNAVDNGGGGVQSATLGAPNSD